LGLRRLLEIVKEDQEFQQYLNHIKGATCQQLIHGMVDGQKSLWIAASQDALKIPFLVVVENVAEGKSLIQDLSNYLGEGKVALLPPRETVFYDLYARSRDLTGARLKVLSSLLANDLKCLVIPIEVLAQRLIPRAIFEKAHFLIRDKQTMPISLLLDRLVFAGYERVDLVESAGQFSARGDIVDVFTPSMEQPVRIEFFDEEVEALRPFDSITQRSKGNLASLVISPARELLIDDHAKKVAVQNLAAEGEQYISKLLASGKKAAARRLKDLLGEWLGYFKDDLWVDDLERLQPFLYEQHDSILDYFPKPPAMIICEPNRVLDVLKRIEQEKADALTDLLQFGKAIPGLKEIDFEYQQVKGFFTKGRTVYLSSLPRGIAEVKLDQVKSLSGKDIPFFHGNFKLLSEELFAWKKKGHTILLVVSTNERAKRLQQYLWEKGLEMPIIEGTKQSGQSYGRMAIVIGSLAKGFEVAGFKLVLISEGELFDKKKFTKRLQNFKEDGTKIGHYGDLKIGDYVVHIQHGIGKYLGIEQLDIAGIHRDYLNIQYFGQDRLYVPTDQAEMIKKYSGSEGHSPKLHKLGSADWQRAKSRVKESVKEMAKKLLELYAAREAVKGFAFLPDDGMQALFEEAFLYTETPDQLKTIAEVKEDMEKEQPMDRLLCGDVGYGKTEVALRAAFKAVQSSKQVALLVPTTVLAQQHYKTFVERFEGFPVTVKMLSRFRTAKEQRCILKDLEKGLVDIVIGTHRILSKDVKFKDLGLLVVDEEQRFGVVHKERIKQIKKNIDVLTLTATPIPRTLHMAIAGIRNMSVIETPPENRYPVQTYVLEYNDNLVRDAIRKELERGGQVYYIHNRIADIEKTKLYLQGLVPEALIGVAHGSMAENQLERVMLKFMEGEYQVLLCTTIVENGLDISNVNTLIVDDADKLGLSQLYQIRGRVGRTNRLAYAYFTYRKDKVLSQLAEKRLLAIKEFTEFGSGFKIAKRDLEIRGAGNILGPEQHGHMLAIGFDLYCKLLEEAVSQL
jgi:transcription-repair coupling factor (superfamily II helicase)